jgi:hypothetical protein
MTKTIEMLEKRMIHWLQGRDRRKKGLPLPVAGMH